MPGNWYQCGNEDTAPFDSSSCSDADFQEMNQKLEKEVDELLSGSYSSLEDRDRSSTGTIYSDEHIVQMMKNMELEIGRRKNGSRLMLNVGTAVFGVAVAIFISRFVFFGRWEPIDECLQDNPARFCYSCFGPFFEDWLWCVGN